MDILVPNTPIVYYENGPASIIGKEHSKKDMSVA